MYHPRLKGSHYSMGKKLGRIFKQNQVGFPLQLDTFQKEFGMESGKILKEIYPEAAEEIKGVTDEVEVDHSFFTAWMMCMGCCLVPTDKNVEIRGCTAFSFSSRGSVFYGRNNDLPPFLRKISKSIYYQPANGNRFILNTSSFINGEEGINEHGFVSAMTFVVPNPDEIRPGLNSVFLVRYLLEKCRSTEEGMKALSQLPIASSCNILLADLSGDMCVMECTPFGNHRRTAIKNKQGEDFVITVNHFTSKGMQQYDRSNQDVYDSKTRYETVLNALQKPHNDSIEYTQEILKGKHGFLCQYKKELNFDTIWSSVFDLSNRVLYRTEGNPSRSKFRKDLRLK